MHRLPYVCVSNNNTVHVCFSRQMVNVVSYSRAFRSSLDSHKIKPNHGVTSINEVPTVYRYSLKSPAIISQRNQD